MATKVSVGVTSATGYAATLVGLLATVLATVWPDVPQQTLATVAAAVFTVGSFLVTQVGRYVQAKEQIAAKPGSWQGSLSDLQSEMNMLRPQRLEAAKATIGSTTTEPRPSVTGNFAAEWEQRSKGSKVLDFGEDEPGDPDALPEMASTDPASIDPDGDDRKVALA